MSRKMQIEIYNKIINSYTQGILLQSKYIYKYMHPNL